MKLINLEDVNSKIIVIREMNVILDSDVAALYGVETMRVNQAVKRNPDKFPEGYIFTLTESEKEYVITNCDNLKIKFSPAMPNAFTEKGLYMLATILKSEQATQTTLAIIETFTKIRELSREVAELVKDHQNEQKQKTMLQKGGEILSDVIGSDLETTGTEKSFELNLYATVKFKHTVKRRKKPEKKELKQ
jgi:predicted transcriptional regulator